MIAREPFFDVARGLYPKGLKQSQVDGMEYLLGRFETDDRLTDPRHVAYMLATARREAADTYEPIIERGPRDYFRKYGQGRLAKMLGNRPGTEDWFNLRGRGYVQITGYRNYHLFSQLLGVDLIANPELACERPIAYQIMVIGMLEGRFTGRKLGEYIHDDVCSYYAARRTVNGIDHAAEIASHATVFERALRGEMAV